MMELLWALLVPLAALIGLLYVFGAITRAISDLMRIDRWLK